MADMIQTSGSGTGIKTCVMLSCLKQGRREIRDHYAALQTIIEGNNSIFLVWKTSLTVVGKPTSAKSDNSKDNTGLDNEVKEASHISPHSISPLAKARPIKMWFPSLVWKTLISLHRARPSAPFNSIMRLNGRKSLQPKYCDKRKRDSSILMPVLSG